MKEEISFTQVPFDYPLMPQRAMPPRLPPASASSPCRACLPKRITGKSSAPKRLATVKGECPFYRSSQKARYAKGFMNMLNSLPYEQAGNRHRQPDSRLRPTHLLPRPAKANACCSPKSKQPVTERLQTSGCRHGYRI